MIKTLIIVILVNLVILCLLGGCWIGLKIMKRRNQTKLCDLTVYDTGMKPYPNKEAKEVLDYQKTRSDLAKWHYLSDASASTPFALYLSSQGILISPIKLQKIAYTPCHEVQKYKDYYQRPRPYLTDLKIKKRPTVSGYGWSYPSCHSAQGRYLALYLGNKYPKLAPTLNKIGERVGESRIWAGLHFPSDHQKGKEIAEELWSFPNQSRNLN